jgi:hypothetical protein
MAASVRLPWGRSVMLLWWKSECRVNKKAERLSEFREIAAKRSRIRQNAGWQTRIRANAATIHASCYLLGRDFLEFRGL